jgi:phage tail sheath protein FI
MAEYLSPGVYIEEIQGPQPIQAVGTSTGAFVGLAQSGPVNSAQLITNYSQFATTFGNFLPAGFLAYAVQNFFNEGGTRCYVVRAFKNTQLPSPTVPYPDVARANVTTTGVPSDPVAIVVQANSPGTWGNALSVRVLLDTFDAKNTPTATVNAAGKGTGYKATDVLTLSGTGATINVDSVSVGATITVNTVSTTGPQAGAVETFTLTTAGTGYPATNLAVTGGTGTGATFNYSYTPTVTIDAAGTGYKPGDVLTLVQTGASGGTITVSTISAAGAVLTFSLTTGGTGYTTGTGLPVTGGAGSGATFNYSFPTVTLVNGGSGYKPTDVLTLQSGAVFQFHLTNPGNGYPAANGLAVTGGAGTGATFNYVYTVTLNAGGSGYQVGDVLNLVQTGGSGGTITVNTVSTGSPTGAVLTFTLTAAGNGYTTGTGLTVTGGAGTGAMFNYNTPAVTLNATGTGYQVGNSLALVGPSDRTITVNSVSAAGAIVTSTLTNPGVGYLTATAVAASGGSGTGATFDFTVNPNQEFLIQVWQTPQGSTLATLVETYAHVSMIEADANGIPNPNHIEQRINGISKYIFVMHASTEPGSNPPPAPQTVSLTGGTDGLPPGPSSVTAAMHAADFIGTPTTPATSLHAFDTVDDINIVAIPDLMLSGFGVPATDGRNATLQAITYCELRKDCFYVADCPSGLTPQSVLDYKQGTGSTFSGNAFNSKYAALYYPWISILDPLTGGTKLAPPSGAMAGRYSATDVARGVFKAPAGTIDGFINSAMNIERVTSQGEQDTLNPEGVNVIRKFAATGIVIWGARTVSADSEWTYVPVRRLVISIEQSILRGTQGIVFEPNDPTLWARIRRDVGAFLRLEWLSGALFGDKAEQAFFVKCDGETNPPESIALGRVVTLIGIAPVKPAEFVIFRIQLTAAGGSVSE